MAQSVRTCLQCRRLGFDPWVKKIPWRREWQPTPIFLPGEFHGQRSLAGCRPWSLKESDTTERLHFPFLSPGDLPSPVLEPTSPASAGRFFTTEPYGKPTGIMGNPHLFPVIVLFREYFQQLSLVFWNEILFFS